MIVNKIKMTLAEQAEQEYANAQVAQQKADIEYIAMMCDVELDDGSEEAVDSESEI